jgi:uncharacterized protein with von Willebrand factor type A (vWA) domain
MQNALVFDADPRVEFEEEPVNESDLCLDEPNEYIFVIDRSGSMYQSIILARQALKLFLYSLPVGSKFNIISYGSSFDSLFPESVEYTEETLSEAVDQVLQFTANYGGTNILSPLMSAFDKVKTAKMDAHIYLLTDGAVQNNKEIINLVEKNCSPKVRLHTFGVGHGAEEHLIKGCALAGKGSYFFVYENDQIEEKVIEAL